MFTPQEFAKASGLPYSQVLCMCKKGEIISIKSKGGHFKIPPKEMDRFKTSDYVTKDMYMDIVRENERLKTIIEQFKTYAQSIGV